MVIVSLRGVWVVECTWYPTDDFATTEPQNLSIDVSD